MSNNKFDGEGVGDVFGSIASGEGVAELVKTPEANAVVRDMDEPDENIDQSPQGSKANTRPKARSGRFPGRKASSNTQNMERISARITADLKDQYVEWALDERVPVNDLMERALTEFYHRHRGNEFSKSKD